MLVCAHILLGFIYKKVLKNFSQFFAQAKPYRIICRFVASLSLHACSNVCFISHAMKPSDSCIEAGDLIMV